MSHVMMHMMFLAPFLNQSNVVIDADEFTTHPCSSHQS